MPNTVRFHRVLRAAPEKVYRAFLDADALAKWLPYSVARTWHLQIGIFWIATAWLAAGLPEAETTHLTSVIKSIPEQTGALVILVDHDMSLVSAVCETTAVLDFGKLIASGPTAAVLRDENVMRAYLGTAEVAT